ncbi:hypothetical protein FGG08_003909 [Glutinoglossum americanum]|uniref:Uncharacterized protein n=1 Tax=Glutinoglossum americanum TaxID=1670608 RepID=A0A9P8I658_9PEZI|nr:hypothetical protein FGG08_003909 [Glutinoglossum americanum]
MAESLQTAFKITSSRGLPIQKYQLKKPSEASANYLMTATNPGALSDDGNDPGDGYAGLSPAPQTLKTHPLQRFTTRSMVGLLGPVFVFAFYLFIALFYLHRPSINDIIQDYPIDAGSVFYAWSFLSVFVMGWARSALAGLEASALMSRRWAPKNALQLMWHANSGWGGPGGWWKATMLLFSRRNRSGRAKASKRSRGPGKLWYYLSTSSFLFFIALPLTGLTMDRASAFKYGTRKISIVGVNETTFDTRTSPFIWKQASTRWRQGGPTTPSGPTILYAPAGTKNVSEKFYDDAIHGVNRDINAPITFFSGPQVSERARGETWGLLVNVSCVSANPYRGLKLLNVTSPERWYYPLKRVGDQNVTSDDGSTIPVSFRKSMDFFGYDVTVLVAGDRDLLNHSDYASGSGPPITPLPVNGTLEAVLWQAIVDPSTPDASFDSIKSHPHVVMSPGNGTRTSYGFGIVCDFSSTVGFATLDARRRTFSHFNESAATTNQAPNPSTIDETPGILAIQTLVLGALGSMGFGGSTACSDGQSITCNQWLGANLATGGVPTLVRGSGNVSSTRYPALSPERMQMATYKLAGEVAIAMMAAGPGEWTGKLMGLEHAHDLVPGIMPWAPVLALLMLWMVITVVPTFFVLFQLRWASTLGGFELFKMGAEWGDAVHEIQDQDFQSCTSLTKVPGMIGDMENSAPRGFIGLSRSVATKRREYVYDRALAK